MRCPRFRSRACSSGARRDHPWRAAADPRCGRDDRRRDNPSRDLIDRLRGHRLVPRIDDAAEFAEAHQVLLLRHEPSGVDVDLSIAWLPFELDALAAAQPLEVAGVLVAVARAEDLIVYKAVAFRPQDQQDVERLLVLHGHTVDLARIRRLVAEFASALDEPGRLDALEQIIRRVGLA